MRLEVRLRTLRILQILVFLVCSFGGSEPLGSVFSTGFFLGSLTPPSSSTESSWKGTSSSSDGQLTPSSFPLWSVVSDSTMGSESVSVSKLLFFCFRGFSVSFLLFLKSFPCCSFIFEAFRLKEVIIIVMIDMMMKGFEPMEV